MLSWDWGFYVLHSFATRVERRVGSPERLAGSEPNICRRRCLSELVGFPELRLAVSFSAAVSRDLFCLAFRQNNSHRLSKQKGSGTGYRLPVIQKIDSRNGRWVWLCLLGEYFSSNEVLGRHLREEISEAFVVPLPLLCQRNLPDPREVRPVCLVLHTRVHTELDAPGTSEGDRKHTLGGDSEKRTDTRSGDRRQKPSHSDPLILF